MPVKLKPASNEKVFEQYFKVCSSGKLGNEITDVEAVIDYCYERGFPQLRKYLVEKGYERFIRQYWNSYTWKIYEREMDRLDSKKKLCYNAEAGEEQCYLHLSEIYTLNNVMNA